MPARSEEKSALVDAVHRYLSGLDDTHLARFLTAWPPRPYAFRRLAPKSLPVVSCLPALAAGDRSAEEVVGLLKAAAPGLCWGQTYGPDDFGPEFLNRYGWTELVGLRGAVASRRIACGLLLLGAGVEYPLHRHEAEEIYVPLGRPALWRKEAGKWAPVPAGAPIHHGPWTAHGMRTGADPLLAVYLWRGERLDAKSIFCDGGL